MSALVVATFSAAGFLAATLVALAGRGVGGRTRSLSVAVAAGILLALAFADLFPEAIELSSGAAIWGFVVGFAALLLVEAVTRGHTHHSPAESVSPHALAPFVVGLAVHNAADGFVLGVGAEVSVAATFAVGAGVLVHQIPVGMSLAAVFIATRADRSEILRLAVPLALLIPIAAAVTVAIPTPGEATLGALVGAVSGVLTYMGASHLLPEAQSEQPGTFPGVVFVVTLVATTLLLTTVPSV